MTIISIGMEYFLSSNLVFQETHEAHADGLKHTYPPYKTPLHCCTWKCHSWFSYHV